MGLKEAFFEMFDEASPAEERAHIQIEADRKILPLQNAELYKINDLQRWGDEKLRSQHPAYANLHAKLNEYPIPISGKEFWTIAERLVCMYEQQSPSREKKAA